MANLDVEQILKQAESINSKIVKHNNENRKQEGFREATKRQLVAQINEYNSLYGTNLSLDDMDSLQKEYVESVKTIYNETKHLEDVLKAIGENDIKRVSELTGIDIEQDTIKMPVINIDMEEMEKQADKAYKQVEANNAVVPTVFAFNGQDSETEDEPESIVVESEDEGVSFDDETEDEGVSFGGETDVLSFGSTEENQKGIRSFFEGVKVAGQSDAGKKENQTQENTVPNFNNVFGAVGQQTEASKPVNSDTPKSAPDFSSMFSNLKTQGKDESKKEDNAGINSFLANFNTEGSAEKQKPSASDKKVEDALKSQPKIPTFDFSGIDIDED